MTSPEDPKSPEVEGFEDEEDEEAASTPFDNPFFLPVLLVVLTIWFGYDGFFNDDPEMQKYWWFNQPGAAIFAVGALWTGWKALRRRREER